MKRMYQMAGDYFLTRTHEKVEVLQSEFEVIKKYLDYVWINKNK